VASASAGILLQETSVHDRPADGQPVSHRDYLRACEQTRVQGPFRCSNRDAKPTRFRFNDIRAVLAGNANAFEQLRDIPSRDAATEQRPVASPFSTKTDYPNSNLGAICPREGPARPWWPTNPQAGERPQIQRESVDFAVGIESQSWNGEAS
jgi:hypothetical protein